MALDKKTPDIIRANLKIKTVGVEKTLALTYRNHDPEKYDEFVQNPENMKVPDNLSDGSAIAHMNAHLLIFLIASFDDGTDAEFPLNVEGLVSMEQWYPGILLGLVRGYHQARGVQIEKN